MSARIDDHTAWAARGYWRNAYESLLADTRTDTIPAPMQDQRVKALVEALQDAMSGLEYVRYHYGELHGVGFMRVRDAGDAALSAITKEPPHER